MPAPLLARKSGRPHVETPSLFDSSYGNDFSDWTERSPGTTSWSFTAGEPGTNKGRIRWIHDAVNYGGLLHPRQKATGTTWAYAVHLRLMQDNFLIGAQLSFGPAVNMRDRGVNTIPDGWFVTPVFSGVSLVILSEWKAGVLTSVVSSVASECFPGDVLSLWHSESGGTAKMDVAVNGKRIITHPGRPLLHGSHTATDMPGIMGSNLGVVGMDTAEWWVTKNDIGFVP